MNCFDHLVGQEKIKLKLNHFLKVFDAKGTCPFLLFDGPKGIGKTEFARTFIRELKNSDGSRRSAIELNCGGIKNVENFFSQIFTPVILDNEVTVFFDEAHELPQDLTNAFLTIFNTEKSNQREFHFRDTVFPFDFKRQTFLFATTESDRLFPPFKERLTSIDFEEYEIDEIKTLISSFCENEGITLTDFAKHNLASVSRGNARSAVKLSRTVVDYCWAYNIREFDIPHYKEFVRVLGINPMGISETEKRILSILNKEGPCSLQELSSKTGLSSQSLRKSHEIYILKKNLMKIDVKRKITKEGQEALSQLS